MLYPGPTPFAKPRWGCSFSKAHTSTLKVKGKRPRLLSTTRGLLYQLWQVFNVLPARFGFAHTDASTSPPPFEHLVQVAPNGLGGGAVSWPGRPHRPHEVAHRRAQPPVARSPTPRMRPARRRPGSAGYAAVGTPRSGQGRAGTRKDASLGLV